MKIKGNLQKNGSLVAIGAFSLVGLVVICLMAAQPFFQSAHHENGDDESKIVEFEGSMMASDAGVSKGGFEWTASYFTHWKISKESREGVLNITLNIGLGSQFPDEANSVELQVNDFYFNGTDVTFACWSGIEEKIFFVSMSFVQNDAIWGGQYNNHYIAIQSSDPTEIRGLIDPSMIPGFIDWFYIELRMSPSADLSVFTS
jgi:hypothetical protein